MDDDSLSPGCVDLECCDYLADIYWLHYSADNVNCRDNSELLYKARIILSYNSCIRTKKN
jgi:hypothetical protein